MASVQAVRRSIVQALGASLYARYLPDERIGLQMVHHGAGVGEGLLNRIEMVVRSYDPCFSCAAHTFPGPGSLAVTLRDHRGAVVGRLEGTAAPPATRA